MADNTFRTTRRDPAAPRVASNGRSARRTGAPDRPKASRANRRPAGIAPHGIMTRRRSTSRRPVRNGRPTIATPHSKIPRQPRQPTMTSAKGSRISTASSKISTPSAKLSMTSVMTRRGSPILRRRIVRRRRLMTPPTSSPDQYAAPGAALRRARLSGCGRGFGSAALTTTTRTIPFRICRHFCRGLRDDRRGYAQDQSQDQYPDQDQQGDPDDQSYALEDYEERKKLRTRKRRGFAIVAAIFGLVVLGTAGAFAYRAMFGGSMLPSLPPIIKADDRPNKIVPAGNATALVGPSEANNAGSPDKLVSREEKAGRCAGAGEYAAGRLDHSDFPGSQCRAAVLDSAGHSGHGTGRACPARWRLGPVRRRPAGARRQRAQRRLMAARSHRRRRRRCPEWARTLRCLAQQPIAGSSGSKKIHTVAIHPGSDSGDAAAAAPPPAPAPHFRRRRRLGRRAEAARGGAGAGRQCPAVDRSLAARRHRSAGAHPHRARAPDGAGSRAGSLPSAGGGYSVQVSSQRSEAEAQAGLSRAAGQVSDAARRPRLDRFARSILATRASFTARWSAPLPRWNRRRRCARA